EAISQWHHAHVVLTHLKKNRFGFGRLDFAASMAVTLAVEVRTVPLAVLGHQLPEIGSRLRFGDQPDGELAGSLGVWIFARVEKDVLPGDTVGNLEFFRMTVVILSSLLVTNAIDGGHDPVAYVFHRH